MPFFAIALTFGVVGGGLTYAVAKAHLGRHPGRPVLLGLVWVWAAGVVSLTFGTRSGGGQAVNIALLDVGNPADIVDFLLNMALFLPGGVLFAALGCRWFTAGLFGFSGSLAIETTQYLVHSGRTSDLNDLLSNTLGCLVGFAVAALVGTAVGRSPEPSTTVEPSTTADLTSG
ncbi:VanZ family protein [Streptomyces nigrescens]|nr:VanZ family protein [Streptomyces nigrescens]